MSYTVEKLEKSQVKISFDVDAPVFEKAVQQAYEKTKHKFAIAGFRKGHVPRKVLEGIYGKEVFFEDAMDIVIPEAYGETLEKEKDLDVVAQPELTAFDFKKDGGATFTLIVTVKPEVKLGEYKALSVEKKAEKVSAKEVEAEIEQERQKQARLIDVETEAFSGNIVTIDFVGKADGVAFDGGSAEGYELELGSNSFIPGFEEQLIGIKAGESRDVKVTFPDDYHAENLKGKEAVFECKCHAVKVKELPAFDDDFVKDVSEMDTVDEYKKDVREKLQKTADEKAEREYEDALVEAVVAGAEVEIPAAMVEAEAEAMLQEFEYRLMYQGLKIDDYLKYLNITKEQLLDEYKPQAEKSVKVRLSMEAIVKVENIQIADTEIEEKLAAMAQDAKKTVEEYKKTVKHEQIDYIVNQLLSKKLMDRLKELNPPKSAKAAKKAEAAQTDDTKTEKPTAKKAAPKAKSEKPETGAKTEPTKKAAAEKTPEAAE